MKSYQKLKQQLLKDRQYGASMRLGTYHSTLRSGTLARRLYKEHNISERHRHRYELNNDYREQLEAAGLKVAGVYPQKNLVEIVELARHPFFVGVQFHPEFTSRPLQPHPIFAGLIAAAVKRKTGHQRPLKISSSGAQQRSIVRVKPVRKKRAAAGGRRR